MGIDNEKRISISVTGARKDGSQFNLEQEPRRRAMVRKPTPAPKMEAEEQTLNRIQSRDSGGIRGYLRPYGYAT